MDTTPHHDHLILPDSFSSVYSEPSFFSSLFHSFSSHTPWMETNMDTSRHRMDTLPRTRSPLLTSDPLCVAPNGGSYSTQSIQRTIHPSLLSIHASVPPAIYPTPPPLSGASIKTGITFKHNRFHPYAMLTSPSLPAFSASRCYSPRRCIPLFQPLQIQRIQIRSLENQYLQSRLAFHAFSQHIDMLDAVSHAFMKWQVSRGVTDENIPACIP